MVGGGAFVVLHMSEWLKLINVEHVTPLNNPWGVPLFGGTFFALTGLHMTHVICRADLSGHHRDWRRPRQIQGRGCGSQRPLLALCRSGVDVHLPPGLFDVRPSWLVRSEL
jgi:hypothetical protein